MAIQEYAEMLKGADLHYINPSVSIEYTGCHEVSDSLVELQAMESIFMEIEGHGTDTGYAIEHNFRYQKMGEEWKLIEDQILSPYGMVKDEKAMDFTAVDSPYYKLHEEEQ